MARAFAVPSLSLPLGGMALFGTLLLSSACSRPIGPAACTDPRDCAAGEACVAGVCSVAGSGSCTTDLDCDLSAGQVCSGGTCVAGSGDPDPSNDGGSCTATADCPITQFCNTATGFCSALLEGWCRQDSQCGDNAPLCSNVSQGSDYPGRCVECVTNDDCGGAECVSPGVCAADTGCGDNASAVAGGGCRCNPGFVDNGAGCVPNVTSEGEGEGDVGSEGEGEGDVAAEGEGEGDGAVDGESCSTADECFELHDINWTCGDAGTCQCDEPWLDFICDGDYDLAACDCGGGGGTTTNKNTQCDVDADCGGGLSCIFGAGAGNFDPGFCKQTCETNADCDDGLDCMAPVFADGSGICADVRGVGATCEASIYSADIGTDALCDGSGDAIIDCFSGRCAQVCDWEGNTGPEQSCDAGSCGNLTFRSEVGGDVATCQ